MHKISGHDCIQLPSLGHTRRHKKHIHQLVGGFSPTHLKNMLIKMGIISPNRDEHKQILETTNQKKSTNCLSSASHLCAYSSARGRDTHQNVLRAGFASVEKSDCYASGKDIPIMLVAKIIQGINHDQSSGQITIFPKPELRRFREDSLTFHHHFGVTFPRR